MPTSEKRVPLKEERLTPAGTPTPANDHMPPERAPDDIWPTHAPDTD
jgi:hypothetical protein